MEDIFTKLKTTFKTGGILIQLIYINCGVFLAIRVLDVLFTLFGFGDINVLRYSQYPSLPSLALCRAWTIVTYQFTHYEFWHLLFNMLWLYWFGQIFLQFFTQRQLMGLYLLGGISGALLFTIAYNVFPYFTDMAGYSFLVGASASVMAVVFAISFYKKDYEIGLLFIGRVKLLYLAIGVIAIDFLSITSANAGGHIAHIGGAAFGVLFAYMIQRGTDVTSYLNILIDKIVNLFGKREPKMRVTYRNKREADYDYNARKQKESAEIDDILDKLKRSGYGSLTSDEKKKLFDASKK